MLLPSAANPGRDLLGNGTLFGLREVGVSTSTPERTLKRVGLPVAEIERNVVGLLREAGIGIVETDRTRRPPGPPELMVALAAEPLRDTGYMVSVLLSLKESVVLVRDRSMGTEAATWQKLGMVASQAGEGGEVLALIVNLVDSFVADWRASNG